MADLNKLIESLSLHERKILPYLNEKIPEICKKTNLNMVSVIRALEYLQNKKIVELSKQEKKIIEAGINGAFYIKKGLPERRLLNVLEKSRISPLSEAQKKSGLTNEEFKASIGALKKKGMIDLKNGKLFLTAQKSEISKKTLEEIFLEKLPLDYKELKPEDHFALKSLERRKDIIYIKEEKIISIKITPLGSEILKKSSKTEDLIEQLTPEIILKENLWKKKRFRRYDLTSPIPLISGGKRHFVNQAVDHAKQIWLEMGFEEMTGKMVQSSFWNFDALFTAQDHSVREMQDTFFIDKKSELPEKKIVDAVKKAHVEGVDGSEGWKSSWSEEEAKKTVLRTHTTCLSAKTLSSLKKENIPAKFFAIGRCFRNETLDWSHGFEFNQSEGIVVDKNANFRNLLWYLREFYKKMGFEKVRFTPSYFPYTEPSVEIHVWHPEKKIWLELGGAGILRPEVTIPLLGEKIPVLAWGPGFDRMLMDYYGIKDLREMYKNNLDKLRKMKFWIK